MSRRVELNEKPAVHHHEPTEHGLEQTGTRVTGTDKEGSSRYADSEAGLEHRAGLAKSERRLLMKLDAGILPFAILLYLSAYLDRGNMANARLQGLQDQVLEGSDNNYSIALVCFFITYIVCSIPGTLMAKQFDPSKTIAIGCLIWSVAATCQAATMNPGGLFTCRLFIGIGEAMFGQAMAFHLSLWYTKKDLAKRVGLFISAGAVAGAFGGLIAFGVSSIERSTIAQWRILFLIEGVPSVVLGLCTYFLMPGRPETSRYLSEDERTLCLTRLNRTTTIEAAAGIDWKGVRRCAMDWKVYVIAIMYSCMNLTLASVGGFLPTIIKGFGYTNARLFTVPPYAVALVFMLLLTSFSDWKQARGIPVMSVFLIGIVGWAILLSVQANPALASQSQLSARYFACCCIVTAGYTNIPLIISWQAANNPNESQRATSLGYLNSIGQCLSLAASFLFPSPQGPQYTQGCIVNIAFQSFGLLIALGMTTYFRLENKRRNREEGTPVQGEHLNTYELFDKAPGFRFVS